MATIDTDVQSAGVRRVLWITNRGASVGIIGLGYVGLPLVIRFCQEEFHVLGFDIDPKKVERLNKGESYIKHISSEKIKSLRGGKIFEATSDYSRLKDADCILIWCSNASEKEQRA